MGDEPENKKKAKKPEAEGRTDKVISMKDFLKDTPEGDNPVQTVEAMFEYISQFNLENAVVVGEDADGRMAFFSNCTDFQEILFFLEAYKKMIMDRSFGQY